MRSIWFITIVLFVFTGCDNSVGIDTVSPTSSNSSQSSSLNTLQSSSTSNVSSSSSIATSSSSQKQSSSVTASQSSSSSVAPIYSSSSSSIATSSSSQEQSSSVASESTPDATSGTETNPTSRNWANVKIGGGGYIPGLVFHPTTPNLLYARTDIGGAYRWNPNSSKWIAITDAFSTLEGRFHGTESMAIDPNDANIVYMSTGMYLAGGNGRLYISSDRGDNWSYAELPFPVGSNNQGRGIGERMMVDPNLPSTLFYGSRTAGLWKSTNSGRDWSQISTLSSAVMTSEQINNLWFASAMGMGTVVFDTSSKDSGHATQSIYVSVSPDYAEVANLAFSLYRTSDGGENWVGVETPVAGYHIPHMVRAEDGMFYVAFTKDAGPGAGGPARLYKFDGENWTLLKSYDTTEYSNFGFGGLSVYGSGSTTRIALGITNSWGGDWEGKPVVALSDDAGITWREISAGKPHIPQSSVSGWIDDVEIDPSNPDHILHVYGGGVWHTYNASDTDPVWHEMVEGIEEIANVAMTTPPAGASYFLLNSSLDIGSVVHTSLDTPPTLGPKGDLALGSGFSIDMAWSNPAYIATIGHPAKNVPGSYSTDAGNTWTAFATFPPDIANNYSGQSNIAVTKPYHIVWAQANSIPYYTTDNGANWIATNLPALEALSVNRGYHLAADRQNSNKVYAYDSGGAWWGTPGKFFYSNDGGHTFAQITHPDLSLRANDFQHTWLAVNPYTEGDVWIADGNSLYHSIDSGTTWVKLTTMQSVWGANPTWKHPEVFGATTMALGKPAPGSSYSAAIYMVGVVEGIYGLFRSDDMGENWIRINDDDHQFGGIGRIAADNEIYGRVYISGGGRGMLYNSKP